MIDLTIDPELRQKITQLSLGLVYAEVKNSSHHEELWKLIDLESNEISNRYSLENIKYQANIELTKEAYKRLGKDPNRYRPSAEALYRRIIKGAPLYQISTLVDVINYVSLKTGFSINGFDVEKIEGVVSLGIGGTGEQFEAIGRGELNIQDLPLYRDAHGPIGTPTSDHVRTSIGLNTTKVFLVINNYSADRSALETAVGLLSELLTTFCAATFVKISII